MKTLQHLERMLGSKLVREPVAKMWYAGTYCRWSPVANKWIVTNERCTIRPGDKIPQMGDELIAIFDV